MRLAFVDLEFSWPPPGGAQIDLVNTMMELEALGHEVHLFAAEDESLWRFGDIDPSIPIPVSRLGFPRRPFTGMGLGEKFRVAVDAWRPDVVFLCFGFFLKVELARALSHYPLITRYSTYEMLCIRDFYLFKEETTCPNSFLKTPNICRRCFVSSWKDGILHTGLSAYAREFIEVDGFSSRFYREFVEHIQNFNGIVVYNEMTRQRLLEFNSNVHVVTGGVRIEDFKHTPLPNRAPGEKTVIFMAGRVDDPTKGVDTLMKACHILASHRDDFELWLTVNDVPVQYPWLKCVGWMPHEALIEKYKEVDIFVVPSQWDEPFGLVAVEAMATGRPVCASRVGGLQHIVEHEETGLLFERGDYAALSFHLARLLDDTPLRERFGQAARQRAETFDWKEVVARSYPPLLESVTR